MLGHIITLSVEFEFEFEFNVILATSWGLIQYKDAILTV